MKYEHGSVTHVATFQETKRFEDFERKMLRLILNYILRFHKVQGTAPDKGVTDPRQRNLLSARCMLHSVV